MATTNKEIKVYSLSQVPRGFEGYVLHDRGLGRDYHLYYCCGDKLALTFIESTPDCEYYAQAETADNGSMLGLPLRGWEHQ